MEILIDFKYVTQSNQQIFKIPQHEINIASIF